MTLDKQDGDKALTQAHLHGVSDAPDSGFGSSVTPAWLHQRGNKQAMGCAMRQTRSVVIGMTAFNHLRLVQNNLVPSPPRLDMRYLVEGAVGMLTTHHNPQVKRLWLALATEALLQHARSGQPGGHVGLTGTQHDAGHDVNRAQERSEDGNTRAIDGKDGKSLQISESCFQLLKATQDTTRDPRLGMRYLAEGAIGLAIERRGDWLNAWVYLARQALYTHLTSLQLASATPTFLENSL